ncbi:hypothetical protein L218DRAFT_1007974 [Marasmius fiardii PR-910]|nr:hypothetical protein L218DRAFT_1007974 [Marasmius fiardii PR-910]
MPSFFSNAKYSEVRNSSFYNVERDVFNNITGQATTHSQHHTTNNYHIVHNHHYYDGKRNGRQDGDDAGRPGSFLRRCFRRIFWRSRPRRRD